MSSEQPPVEAPERRGTWDWGTAILTGLAAAAVVGVVTLQLADSVPGAVVGGLIGGLLVGLLSGYRPLHDDDALAAEGEAVA